MTKVNIGVKIEEEMRLKIEYISKQKVLSYADTVRVALSTFIQIYEKENGKIKL